MMFKRTRIALDTAVLRLHIRISWIKELYRIGRKRGMSKSKALKSAIFWK